MTRISTRSNLGSLVVNVAPWRNGPGSTLAAHSSSTSPASPGRTTMLAPGSTEAPLSRTSVHLQECET